MVRGTLGLRRPIHCISGDVVKRMPVTQGRQIDELQQALIL